LPGPPGCAGGRGHGGVERRIRRGRVVGPGGHRCLRAVLSAARRVLRPGAAAAGGGLDAHCYDGLHCRSRAADRTGVAAVVLRRRGLAARGAALALVAARRGGAGAGQAPLALAFPLAAPAAIPGAPYYYPITLLWRTSAVFVPVWLVAAVRQLEAARNDLARDAVLREGWLSMPGCPRRWDPRWPRSLPAGRDPRHSPGPTRARPRGNWRRWSRSPAVRWLTPGGCSAACASRRCGSSCTRRSPSVSVSRAASSRPWRPSAYPRVTIKWALS
jgi:hypothetical protein